MEADDGLPRHLLVKATACVPRNDSNIADERFFMDGNLASLSNDTRQDLENFCTNQ